MSKEEILEGNKLIDQSEFGEQKIRYQNCPLHLLKYHSSWDRLMPVWVKSMCWYREEFGLLTSTFEISNFGININSKNSTAFKHICIFNKTITEDEIKEYVFTTLVHFIKWYNQK